MTSNITECTSLQSFIDCIKYHNCSQNPRIINWNRSEQPTVFKVGFRCLDCGKVWCFGLSSLKKSTKALEDGGLSLLKEYNELAKGKNGQILCDGFIDTFMNKF
jgi:hypothetical protein